MKCRKVLEAELAKAQAALDMAKDEAAAALDRISADYGTDDTSFIDRIITASDKVMEIRRRMRACGYAQAA